MACGISPQAFCVAGRHKQRSHGGGFGVTAKPRADIGCQVYVFRIIIAFLVGNVNLLATKNCKKRLLGRLQV